MSDTTALIDLITRGGLLSALLVALMGGMRGWYVWGSQHKDTLTLIENNHKQAIADKNSQIEDLRKDRDYWKTAAISALSTAGRSVVVNEALAKKQE